MANPGLAFLKSLWRMIWCLFPRLLNQTPVSKGSLQWEWGRKTHRCQNGFGSYFMLFLLLEVVFHRIPDFEMTPVVEDVAMLEVVCKWNRLIGSKMELAI